MSIDTSKFDKVKNEVLIENNAQTIFDNLNELEKDSTIHAKRWFWELLQNAKDSVGITSKVSIKLIFQDNKLSFLHTGEEFAYEDIIHLIFHGSSKIILEGKTGRFGTGFMTTHLLSRKVNISGKLSDNTYFSFELNREAIDPKQQQSNLENSYNLFCESNSINNYCDGTYNTVFTYDLLDHGIQVAQGGIIQLQKILPFVMAFNEKIEEIQIIDKSNPICIKRESKEKMEYQNCNIIDQEIVINDKINNVVLVKLENSEVAVLLERKEGSLRIVELNEDYPKLFLDFPLFGTEKFGCPVVINSPKFDLRGERDGIYLGGEDKDKPTIIENKRIVSNSLNCLIIIIKFLSEKNNITEIYNLFKIANPFEYTWLHKVWLENLYINIINALLNTEIIKLKDKSIKLNNMVLPFSKSIDANHFYKLVTDLVHNLTPQFEEVREWIKVADGFSKLDSIDISIYGFIFNEEKLCKYIEEKKTLQEVNNNLIENDPNDRDNLKPVITWFNKLFSLLSKEQTTTLASQYNIIPNQKKLLIKKNLNVPFLDKIGNENIKDVSVSFGWDVRSELIYQDIVFKEGIFISLTMEKVLTNISKYCDDITESKLEDVRNRKAFIENLKWLIDNKKLNLIKETYVIIERSKDSQQSRYEKRRLYKTESDKLLSPSSLWNDKFSLYKEIVSKKFILIDEYSDSLMIEDFKYLQSEDLIHICPLLIKKHLTKYGLKLLVSKEESYSKLLNEKGEIIDINIEHSDIAYLTTSDDNILSKTADSIKSAKTLLKFLLTQILKHDNLFNQTDELKVGDEAINISKCLWISRLRDTQWVPVKSKDVEKQNTSERPSVANITELIRDEPEILNIVKTKSAALFFNQLGISVADIIRNTLTSEDEKLQWDLMFSQLLTNSNINPDLAAEMLSDPKLQDVYLEQKRIREQIKTNQNIGYLFESIFRVIFESTELKDQGFSIERTAIGSDFSITCDEDIVDDSGKENIFKIGKVLVELKATRKVYAEMTTTQAEEAIKNINNYVLAVLPLNSYELNESTIKKNSRFIVNIAEPLKSRYEEFTSYMEKKILAIQEQEGVKLNIIDGNIRYQVKSELWENNSLNFEDFLKWLKNGYN